MENLCLYFNVSPFQCLLLVHIVLPDHLHHLLFQLGVVVGTLRHVILQPLAILLEALQLDGVASTLHGRHRLAALEQEQRVVAGGVCPGYVGGGSSPADVGFCHA